MNEEASARRPRSSITTPALVLTSLTACSFALPVPRSDYKPTETPLCTRSRSAPAGDLIIAGTSLFFLSAAAACAGNSIDDGEDVWLKECSDTKTVMLATGVIATVAIFSALRGFSKTSTCRKQWRLHQDCLANGPGHCTIPERTAPVAPAHRVDEPSPECQAHRQAIRAATDLKERTRLIRKTPSRCLQ